MSEETPAQAARQDDQVAAYEPPVVEDIDTTHGPAVTAAAAGFIRVPSGGGPLPGAAPRQL